LHNRAGGHAGAFALPDSRAGARAQTRLPATGETQRPGADQGQTEGAAREAHGSSRSRSTTRLEALATEVGDRDTAQLAKTIRRDEDRMATFLDAELRRLVKDVVRSEVPRDQQANGTRRRTTRRRTTRRSRGSSSARKTASGSSARR
jgi:hypothetical protein